MAPRQKKNRPRKPPQQESIEQPYSSFEIRSALKLLMHVAATYDDLVTNQGRPTDGSDDARVRWEREIKIDAAAINVLRSVVDSLDRFADKHDEMSRALKYGRELAALGDLYEEWVYGFPSRPKDREGVTYWPPPTEEEFRARLAQWCRRFGYPEEHAGLLYLTKGQVLYDFEKSQQLYDAGSKDKLQGAGNRGPSRAAVLKYEELHNHLGKPVGKSTLLNHIKADFEQARTPALPTLAFGRNPRLDKTLQYIMETLGLPTDLIERTVRETKTWMDKQRSPANSESQSKEVKGKGAIQQ